MLSEERLAEIQACMSGGDEWRMHAYTEHVGALLAELDRLRAENEGLSAVQAASVAFEVSTARMAERAFAEADRLRAEVSALRLQRDAALAEVEHIEQALGLALYGLDEAGKPRWGKRTARDLTKIAVREIQGVAQRRAIERALNAEG